MADVADGVDAGSGAAADVSEHMSNLAQRRWAKGRAAQAMREAMTGGEPHPLFPTEPGEPIPQIDWIAIARFEKRGTVDCPRIYPASELTTLDDIANMYGGGNYELRGRCSGASGQPGPMVRRARYTIEGRSYPFTGEDAAGAEGEAAQAQAAPAMDPIVLFMTMMKESQAEARAAGERQMQLLVAMMTQSAQQQTSSMQAMASIIGAAMGSNKGPDLGTMLTAVAGMSSAQLQAFAQMMPRPDTSDPIERMGKLMEVAKAMKGDQDSLTSLMSGFGQAAAGIAELERASAAAKAAGAQSPAQQQQQPAAAAEQQQQPPAQANGHAPPAMGRRSEAEMLE
jgi:hypothetical protein